MRRLILILLAVFILAGCGVEAAFSGSKTGKLSVVATIFPVYDFVRAVAGDRAEVTMLLPPSADSHVYEPSPRDIIALQECDVFFYIGGASDVWTENVLSDEHDVTSIRLFDYVRLLEENASCRHAVQNYAGFDEHIWTSPRNAVLMVNAVLDALCEADPKNAEFYRENAQAYVSELEALDEALREIVQNAARRTLIMADRFSLRYFAECYGLEFFSAFPGCADETEPAAHTIALLIEKIRAEKLPAILYGEQSDLRTAYALSRETGADVMLFHSAHTVTQSQFNEGVGYIDLMKRNKRALERALGE